MLKVLPLNYLHLLKKFITSPYPFAFPPQQLLKNLVLKFHSMHPVVFQYNLYYIYRHNTTN
jgi:hypothetical protein